MAGDTEIFEPTKLHCHIQDIIQRLPSYAGEFNPKAYVNWELTVDKEFRKYDLFEEQKVIAASTILTNYALTLWKHLSRHDKVPKTWKVMKRILRENFVPEYYSDHMLAKLESLKQGGNSVKVYYHDLKFHIMCCGLEECEEATENRFLRGLNTEIQDILINETYNSLSHLIDLASKIENEIANGLSDEIVSKQLPSCEKNNTIAF